MSSSLLRPEETQQPTNGDGFIENNTDIGLNKNKISPSGIAAIASIANILLILAVLIIALALGIVIYRRWKVNQVKKALLQMHPAHLAIGTSNVLLVCFFVPYTNICSCYMHADNATYDLPMLGQDYRLFKTIKKGKRSRRSTGRLSTTSENLYESPYDEANN